MSQDRRALSGVSDDRCLPAGAVVVRLTNGGAIRGVC